MSETYLSRVLDTAGTLVLGAPIFLIFAAKAAGLAWERHRGIRRPHLGRKT